jgi:hypothetical protein
VVDIEKNTKSIWQLNATHSVSSQLLGGAKAIEDNAVAILGALSKNDKK